jgi:hypothetical protein
MSSRNQARRMSRYRKETPSFICACTQAWNMNNSDTAETSQAIVIKSSVWKLLWLVVLLGALLLMAVAALPSMAGWSGTVFLGALFPIALYIYRPGATFLKLHANGLDIATAGRQRTINWSDVLGFHIAENRGDKQIAILYADDYLVQNSTQLLQVPDSDIEWIRDLYVIPLDKLCDTLNSWAAKRNSVTSNLPEHIVIDRY